MDVSAFLNKFREAKSAQKFAVKKELKCQPLSVSVNVLVMKVSPRDITKNQPLRFSFVPVEDVTIPYIFRTSKKPKVIKEAVKDAQPITIPAGTCSHFISMFSQQQVPTPGSLYHLDGVYYDIYQASVDVEPMVCISCARFSHALPMNISQLMRTIPFHARSFDLSRDLPSGDIESYLRDETWRFIYVKVGEDTKETNSIFGVFTPQPFGEPACLSYKPKNQNGQELPEILALTGGMNNEYVADNQFRIVQRGTDSCVLILGLTKLFDTSIARFQVDWKKLGAILIPFIYGDAFCLIDRKRTNDMSVADEQVEGVVCLSTQFMPDCARMAKAVGFKISWETAVKFDARLGESSMIKFPEAPNCDLTYATAINILRYSGNISCIERGCKEGYIELYVMTNRIFADEERRQKFASLSEENIYAGLVDPEFYTYGIRETAIFAVPTSKSSCHIKEFVSSVGIPKAIALFNQQASSTTTTTTTTPSSIDAAATNNSNPTVKRAKESSAATSKN